MSLWFHRNIMKNSNFITFELGSVTCNKDSTNICSELRKCRNEIFELLRNPYNQSDLINNSLNNYLSLLHGFITSLDDSQKESKLRFIINYKWSNSVYTTLFSEQADCLFECLSMLYSIALWFTKHAAALAAKNSVSEEEVLEIYRSMKTAAGIFLYIKNAKGDLKHAPEQFSDLDDNVLEVYYQQCLAEAQEISLARAIELKHKSDLIASLSLETSMIFKKAVAAIASLNHKQFLKWRLYLQFKSDIYLAYAYNYYGEFKLSEDHCGEAIKYLQESKSNYLKAEQHGKLYSLTDGPGVNVKPLKHLFFQNLGPILQRTLDKCIMENGLIYHQKIPSEVTDLELKATYGVVAVEEYQLPQTRMWTSDIYKNFNVDMKKCLSKNPRNKEESLSPMKEVDIEVHTSETKNISGCVIT